MVCVPLPYSMPNTYIGKCADKRGFITDESGWAWMIPLHNGRTSIGVVMNQEVSNNKKRTHPSGSAPSLQQFYKEELRFAPGVLQFIGTGELRTDIKSASDYSYSASSYAGEGYRIVGDAGGECANIYGSWADS